MLSNKFINIGQRPHQTSQNETESPLYHPVQAGQQIEHLPLMRDDSIGIHTDYQPFSIFIKKSTKKFVISNIICIFAYKHK